METDIVVAIATEELVELQLLVRNARMRKARREKGFTQKDISLITGISATRIQQIESLRFIPSQDEMEEVSSALEKPVDFLFPPELLEAIKEDVFHERKAQLKAEQVVSLTGAKRLRNQPVLISGIKEVEDNTDQLLLKEQLRETMSIFSLRKQQIIALRFGLNGEDPMTLEAVGQEFYLTGERVRQIEGDVLRKLRHPSRSRKLKSFL